jgi:two-component system CheB/CheR fusion protein
MVDPPSFQVVKSLRESVVFAVQNLIADPPFSKLDLIACRNLLIYLEPEVQKKILRLFHFALNEGGYLFLGSSETIGREVDLFEPISKRWRIYRRIGPSRPNRVEFPIAAHGKSGLAEARAAERPPMRPVGFGQLTQQLLLAAYAPAAVLIDRKYDVLYFFGSTARYLEQPTGEPTQNLMRLAPERLRTRLRSAVHKALTGGAPVSIEGVRLGQSPDSPVVRITVKAVAEPRGASGLLLVTFEDVPDRSPAGAALTDKDDESVVRQLEAELEASREDLQATVDDLEGSNEELKAANEEVKLMNEELQSVNEELETSKEELQSLNEELTTVNSQLQNKLEELETASNDLLNLLNSADIAALFLDPHYCIKRFTPAAVNFLNLIPTDVGRPISDITWKFTDPELLSDLGRVLHDAKPREREIQNAAGRWYLRRIVPYRTRQNDAEGVIVTFVDVTDLRLASQRARRLATVLMDSNDAVTVEDFQGNFLEWNRGAERMYGYTEAEALAMQSRQLIPPAFQADALKRIEQLREGQQVESQETQRICKGGQVIDVWITLTTLYDEHRTPYAVAATQRDVSQQKALERESLEIATTEQRRIGLDLHDDGGQRMTGLILMAQSMAESLADNSQPEAELARKIVGGLKTVMERIRTLAKGLLPVDVDGEGLMNALAELSRRTSELKGVTCLFHCDRPVLISNNFLATQLYRIVQESVANALKHGHAKRINITWRSDGLTNTLTIHDDGVGISPQPKTGMGLRIMRYRAALIGAKLALSAAEGGGTLVSCDFTTAMDHDE